MESLIIKFNNNKTLMNKFFIECHKILHSFPPKKNFLDILLKKNLNTSFYEYCEAVLQKYFLDIF